MMWGHRWMAVTMLVVLAATAGRVVMAQDMNMTSVGAPSPGMGMNMSKPIAMNFTSPDACVADPTQADCASYTLPQKQAIQDVGGLCAAMPYMVGCSLNNACENGTASGALCDPFVILATICYEMPGMRDCANYNSLCSTPGSVVEECTTIAEGVANAPSTAQATDAVLTMCAEMEMKGCDACTSKTECPQPLETLSQICLGMPGMSGCSQFFAMCNTAGSTFTTLCGSSAPVPSSTPSSVAAPPQGSSGVAKSASFFVGVLMLIMVWY